MDNVDGPNNFNIDEFFEQAMERIDAGEPVDAILADCPKEHREELKSLLPLLIGLKDVAYGSVPLPSAEARQSRKSQFLMAAAEEREQQVAAFRTDQGFASTTKDVADTTKDTVADSGMVAPKAQRTVRTLVEPEKPSFFERVFSVFSRPTMRLATLALVALLFLGIGAFAASTSYVGHWAYPIKQLSRSVGLALVPESAREQRVIAQSEAKEKDIQRGQNEAVRKNEEVTFSEKVTVEKVEQSDEGTILITDVGDFVVTLETASEVLSAPESIKVGDVIEFDALILPVNEAPVQLLKLEVVATALPQSELAETPQPVVAPSATACQLNVAGWEPYTIKPDDTLAALAIRGQIDYSTLAQRNCIADPNNIMHGSNIYLPPAAISQPAPANTATPAPTVTVAPVLVEQTATEMPTVVPEVLQPVVINTPLPALPTPAEVDGTVTLTITEPVTETAQPLELEPTATALPTEEPVESAPIAPTTEISSTVEISTVEPLPASPTLTVTVTSTNTVTDLPGDGEATPEAAVETPVPAPTAVDETTSPITETQTLVEPAEVDTTEDSTTEDSTTEDSDTETEVEVEIIVTAPISTTTLITETTSGPISDLPTPEPTLEPTIVPTIVPTSTISPAPQPVEVPTAESPSENLPGDSNEVASPVVPITVTVATETPGLSEPEVGGASLAPTSTSSVNETDVNDTVSEISTATALTPIITTDAELIIAATVTITPIVTLEPTNLAPVASPIPVAPPPPQSTAQTVPEVVPTAVPVPAVTEASIVTVVPAEGPTVLPVIPVVEPETLQPLATVVTDSSGQQLQAEEIQPTIIVPANPTVLPTVVVAPTVVVPTPTAFVSTEAPQSATNTTIPPTATTIVIIPTATTTGLEPVSPLTP